MKWRLWVRTELRELDAEINQAEVAVKEINRRNIAWYRAEIRKLKRLEGSKGRINSAWSDRDWFNEFAPEELPPPLLVNGLMGSHLSALKDSYDRAREMLLVARGLATPDYIATIKFLDRMGKASELLLKNSGDSRSETRARIEWQTRRQFVLASLVLRSNAYVN